LHWHDGTVHDLIKLATKNGKGDEQLCQKNLYVFPFCAKRWNKCDYTDSSKDSICSCINVFYAYMSGFSQHVVENSVLQGCDTASFPRTSVICFINGF
jgi:hypothetical protein